MHNLHMVIRSKQMTMMEEAYNAAFQDEMVQHLWQFSPSLCKAIGDPGVRSVVSLGITRANKYGLTYRGPVRSYLETMLAFGSDFDTDFQYPWAAEALNENFPTQMERATRLFEGVSKYYESAMGPDNEFGIAAMRRFTSMRPEDFVTGTGSLDTRITSALRRMYPQKCDYVGDAVLARLVEKGRAAAKLHSMPGDAPIGLFAGLMFGFGHGVENDPLYPWVRRTLDDPLLATPQDRAARLLDKVTVYARTVLANIDKG